MLGQHVLAQKDAHFASKCIQKLVVTLVDATVDGDQMRLHALPIVVDVLCQPEHVAFLAAVRRPHYHEAVSAKLMLVVTDLITQRY